MKHGLPYIGRLFCSSRFIERRYNLASLWEDILDIIEAILIFVKVLVRLVEGDFTSDE